MTPYGGRFPDLRLGFGDPEWPSLFLDDMYAGRDGFASDGPGHISEIAPVEMEFSVYYLHGTRRTGIGSTRRRRDPRSSTPGLIITTSTVLAEK